ncbi:Signal transduction histidine-protein kinase BaeS [Sulfitobacter pontiacus]|uniref:histidine kinase n=1 Tax=Sulfitobacter pontiacus TaxID=60137 RepID=A0AAX3A9W3_9RHOB|nr:HAMP domain-containing sensor histidine kinase [Sulfitobacter pontiacus]UOA23043.1 Signal transduction histidine-protein kinase BaeS [Sulfitobacter pontiacus]
MFKSGRTSLRLSLQFAFLYSVLSAVIFAGAYWFSNYEVRDWLHDQMNSDREILLEIFEENGIDDLVKSVDVMARVNFENARIFQLLGPDGTVLAGNITQIDGEEQREYVSAENVFIIGEHEEEISGYWIIDEKFGQYTLVQGTGNHVIAEVLEALGISLVSGFILIMGIGSFAGVWVGRLTEQRIEAISTTMEEVAEGKLAARIPIDETSNDDLDRVSTSINNTLEKLENLMESQVQISNDIAHDLRTPLQRLRQRLEKMANQQAVDTNEAVIALAQTEDIINTFNALLRIAQIEAGDRRERFRRTDLRDLVINVYDAFEPTAEDAGQQLRLKISDQPLYVLGDSDLLMQLISNLVENALRHTPEGTIISMEASFSNGVPLLCIADTGPGIAREDREKVFRRFYRGEKSRTSGGNGLGLSLCKAIAELHYAELMVSDNQPGVRILVDFPPAAD